MDKVTGGNFQESTFDPSIGHKQPVIYILIIQPLVFPLKPSQHRNPNIHVDLPFKNVRRN